MKYVELSNVKIPKKIKPKNLMIQGVPFLVYAHRAAAYQKATGWKIKKNPKKVHED